MGPELMARMEAHARATGAEVVADVVTAVDLSARPFRATTDGGGTYLADALILATTTPDRTVPATRQAAAHRGWTP